MPAQPSRAVVEAQHRSYRLAALRKAEELLSEAFGPLPVRLTLIGPEALEAFERDWSGHPGRRYPWPWREMATDFRRLPARLEVAVWCGETLCGLAVGEARRTHVRVGYLEGSPDPEHPLRGKVTPAVLTAVTAYARAVGRGEVRFVDPVDAMVPRYEALGLVLVSPRGEPRYCVCGVGS